MLGRLLHFPFQMPHDCGARLTSHQQRHICQNCRRGLAMSGASQHGDANNNNRNNAPAMMRPNGDLSTHHQRQSYTNTPRRFNNKQHVPSGGNAPFLNWHRRNPPPLPPQWQPSRPPPSTRNETRPQSTPANTSASVISVKSAPPDYSADDDAAKRAAATFKSGQSCWAPYIDGNHYPARFEMFGPADLCVVFFHSFGHHSYVPVASITPK